jgi:hypothetical protein
MRKTKKRKDSNADKDISKIKKPRKKNKRQDTNKTKKE